MAWYFANMTEGFLTFTPSDGWAVLRVPGCFMSPESCPGEAKTPTRTSKPFSLYTPGCFPSPTNADVQKNLCVPGCLMSPETNQQHGIQALLNGKLSLQIPGCYLSPIVRCINYILQVSKSQILQKVK
jgi:hypothetical protein